MYLEFEPQKDLTNLVSYSNELDGYEIHNGSDVRSILNYAIQSLPNSNNDIMALLQSTLNDNSTLYNDMYSIDADKFRENLRFTRIAEDGATYSDGNDEWTVNNTVRDIILAVKYAMINSTVVRDAWAMFDSLMAAVQDDSELDTVYAITWER
jgi:hypothetical protein